MRVPLKLFGLLLILIGSGYVVLKGTELLGVGIQTDSIVYLDVADSILKGHGFFYINSSTGGLTPLSHFPPGYPLCLALVSKALAVTPLIAARWLAFVCLPVLLYFIWCFAGGMRGRYAIWACALMALSTHLQYNFCMVQSEVVFLVTVFAGFFLLNLHIKDMRYGCLFVAGVLIGFSFITRYVGIVAMFTGGLHILLNQKQWRRKIIDASLFSIAALIPAGSWMTWRFLHTGSLDYGAAPPALAMRLIEAYHTVGFWLLPGFVPEAIRAVAVVVAGISICAILIWIVRRESGLLPTLKKLSLESQVLLLFGSSYCILLILTTVFRGCPWPFNERLLLPVQCVLVPLLARMSNKVSVKTVHRRVPLLILLVWIGLTLSYLFRIGVRSVEWRQQGLGITAKIYCDKNWEVLGEILPGGIPIYTDEPSAVFWFTRHPVRPVPLRFLRDHVENYAYTKQVAEMQREMVSGEAACVLLGQQSEEIKKMVFETPALEVIAVRGFTLVYVNNSTN